MGARRLRRCFAAPCRPTDRRLRPRARCRARRPARPRPARSTSRSPRRPASPITPRRRRPLRALGRCPRPAAPARPRALPHPRGLQRRRLCSSTPSRPVPEHQTTTHIATPPHRPRQRARDARHRDHRAQDARAELTLFPAPGSSPPPRSAAAIATTTPSATATTHSGTTATSSPPHSAESPRATPSP